MELNTALRLHDIVPTHLAIKAMRDNGYKNAAYALAELMDNAIEAEARRVELLVAERTEVVTQRQRRRIAQIAVLDDGTGMDATTLRMALQFGNGTRLAPEQQTGMGRFGMGLPSASISQCKRVEVWSWQDGTAGARYAYLDLDEIIRGRMTEVPAPEHRPIPALWRASAKRFGPSGTLVVWNDLDRLTWRSARSLFEHAEFIVGRMYRKFLSDACPPEDRRTIRFYAFDETLPTEPGREQFVRPNDPGYLMENTSCPAPFDREPMFELHHGNYSGVINYNGGQHRYEIRVSVAKEKARVPYGRNAGSQPHGKHAGQNVGVSIVRAGRELELDTSWTIGYDPVERWWGIEISFTPGLDELFGVTNNKQAAVNLHRLSNADLFDGEEFDTAQLEQMREDDDPRLHIRDISHHILKTLSSVREQLRAQTKNIKEPRNTSPGGSHTAPTPEDIATDATASRKEEGKKGASDPDEKHPPEQRVKAISKYLEGEGYNPDPEELERFVRSGRKYRFVETPLEASSAFFSVEMREGVLFVKLNTSHPAYRSFIETLGGDLEEAPEAELRERLANARDGLKLLLLAWARYEDETEGRQRERLQDVRNQWGMMARDFMRSEVDE